MIRNIFKQICWKLSMCTQILLGYVLATKLSSISNNAACYHTLANLFHACMCEVLGPLASYIKSGLEMLSGNGIWCQCHLIVVTYVGDYMEQVLVTCTYYGCWPKFTVHPVNWVNMKHFHLMYKVCFLTSMNWLMVMSMHSTLLVMRLE